MENSEEEEEEEEEEAEGEEGVGGAGGAAEVGARGGRMAGLSSVHVMTCRAAPRLRGVSVCTFVPVKQVNWGAKCLKASEAGGARVFRRRVRAAAAGAGAGAAREEQRERGPQEVDPFRLERAHFRIECVEAAQQFCQKEAYDMAKEAWSKRRLLYGLSQNDSYYYAKIGLVHVEKKTCAHPRRRCRRQGARPAAPLPKLRPHALVAEGLTQ